MLLLSAFCQSLNPAQTIADIGLAEAAFLEKVAALHPDAEGKPCVIGNCQAGWAVMMVAAAASRTIRADHRRRFAAVLLERRTWAIPDALQRRASRR